MQAYWSSLKTVLRSQSFSTLSERTWPREDDVRCWVDQEEVGEGRVSKGGCLWSWKSVILKKQGTLDELGRHLEKLLNWSNRAASSLVGQNFEEASKKDSFDRVDSLDSFVVVHDRLVEELNHFEISKLQKLQLGSLSQRYFQAHLFGKSLCSIHFWSKWNRESCSYFCSDICRSTLLASFCRYANGISISLL